MRALLITAFALSIAPAAQAQTIFQQNLPGDLWGQTRTRPLPQVNYIEEDRQREARARIAAGLIRSGRCDQALQLATRQRDQAMVQRISEVCAPPSGAPMRHQPA